MRATRCNTRARTAPNLTVLMAAIWIPMLALALLCRPSYGADTPTKESAKRAAEAAKMAAKAVAVSDSATRRAAEEGFTVRVIEEKAGGKRTVRVIERKDGSGSAIEIHKQGLPEPPTPPEPPEPPDYDRSNANDLVRFGEDITIPADKVVEGDVVAFGGSVTVLGRVKGDCVSIGGSVYVKDHGVVQGDATSVGGGVVTSDSATVGGSNVSIGGGNLGRLRHFGPMVGAFGLLGTGAWLVKTLVWALIALFFAWLSLLLFRDRFVHANQTMGERFGKSFLFGLLGWVGLVFAVPVGIVALLLFGLIAVVILCITIIGIPVAILLLIALVLGVIGIVVAAAYVSFLAYLQGSMYLGRLVLGRKPATGVNPLIAILVGIVLLGAIDAVGHLIGAVSFFIFQPIGMALGIAATFLLIVFSTAGLGAMLVSRFSAGPWAPSSGSQWGFGGASAPGPVPPGPMPPPPFTPPPGGPPPPAPPPPPPTSPPTPQGGTSSTP